ncbi:MAG: hypothetical protein JW776_06725 [Candidatus Lokiarchaeota archaeon]|nr:hypothetical protein [Candidatus Lokiarchaeota archaeon]
MGTLDQLNELEIYLKDHLSTDWDKIQNAWHNMRAGMISRGEFAIQGIKILGKKFVNFMMNFV